MKILGNATLAPLGNLHNMEMSAAITDISFSDQMCIFTSLLISEMMSDGDKQSVKHNTH